MGKVASRCLEGCGDGKNEKGEKDLAEIHNCAKLRNNIEGNDNAFDHTGDINKAKSSINPEMEQFVKRNNCKKKIKNYPLNK